MKISYLFLAFLQPRRTQSFATYLLSRSNCWTELSTEEIIMNYRVVSHEESDDPQMHIKMVDPIPAGSTTFPTKVALQVVTDNPDTNNRDYQYVMEVNGTGASFVGGSCEENRRIAGRAREMVELTLTSAVPVKVWAGWAAGHEQVRLTPELIILPPDETNEATRKESGEIMKKNDKQWHEELLNSCSNIDWASLETFAGRTIKHSESAELYTDGTVEAPRVALRNADFETLVIHCTAGANVGTKCPHMAVLSASDEWPVLSIEEERNIYISGIFSVVGQPSTLYRTKALELVWTPPGENAGDERERVTEDVEKRNEEEEVETPSSSLVGDVTESRIHEQIMKPRYGLNKEELENKIKDRIDIAERVQRTQAQIERDREAVKKRGDSWKASTNGSTKDTQKRKKPQATPDKPFDHVMVSNNEEISHDSDPVFNVGSHYYIGLAILIGASIIATQYCLISSRRNKGRLDL